MLEMSPSNYMEVMMSSRKEQFNLIQEKESQIEENIKRDNISTKIDLGIIEQLKRRRLEQRQQNGQSEGLQSMESKRDLDVQEIQKKLSQESQLNPSKDILRQGL